MKCPRCEVGVLAERNRDGITIDVCPECRGVWLDRGELERLLARAASEEQELLAQRPRARREDDDDDDDDDDRDRRYRSDAAGPYDQSRDRHAPPGAYKKKRWFDSLGDLFD